jgi:hypothetical protein
MAPTCTVMVADPVLLIELLLAEADVPEPACTTVTAMAELVLGLKPASPE